MLTEVAAILNADQVRPLTDHVTVKAPETVAYNIDVTYYTQEGGAISNDVISGNVNAAVNAYKKWQAEKMGRDVNPSYLIQLLMTRWEIIARIKDRTAASVVKAMDQIERKFGAELFARAFKTITLDNGGEFSDVKRLERSAVRKGKRRTTAYYCHPYSSYERGSNECQNKMIRRRFPKGTDFGKVTAAQIAAAANWMNNYPREISGWKTAEICFRECVAALD